MEPAVVRTVVGPPLIVSVSVAALPKLTAPPDVNVRPSSVTSALNVAPPLATVTFWSNCTAPVPSFCVMLVNAVPAPMTPLNDFCPAPARVSPKEPSTVALTIRSGAASDVTLATVNVRSAPIIANFPLIELAAVPTTERSPPKLIFPVPDVERVEPLRDTVPLYVWSPATELIVTADTSMVSAVNDRDCVNVRAIPALTLMSSLPPPPSMVIAPLSASMLKTSATVPPVSVSMRANVLIVLSVLSVPALVPLTTNELMPSVTISESVPSLPPSKLPPNVVTPAPNVNVSSPARPSSASNPEKLTPASAPLPIPEIEKASPPLDPCNVSVPVPPTSASNPENVIPTLPLL